LTEPSATNSSQQSQRFSQYHSIASAAPDGDAGSPLGHTKFRPDIEGLRAVAVLGVVLFHASVPGVGGGFIGVDVFFVISGFLITGLLWREVSTAGTIRLRRFYGARARRLLPASATVGVVTAIASFLLLPSLLVQPVLLDGITSALYVGNCWFFLEATDYFSDSANASPFLHYWSLGVEEQVYFVWPAIMLGVAWVIRRARRRTGDSAVSPKTYLVVLALIGVVSFAAAVLVTRAWPPAGFFLMPTRAWELAAGGLVALTATQWRRLPPLAAAAAGWIGLAAVLLTCVFLSSTTQYPGIATLVPVLGTALVIGAGCATSTQGAGRLLSLAPMRAIGRVSYSWYLWHWPVLLLAAPLLGHPLGLTGRLVTVVVSAGLAALTLRFIENPLRFSPAVNRSAGRSLAVGGAATAVAVGVSFVLLVSVPLPIGRGPAAPTLAVTVTPPTGSRSVELYDEAVHQAFAQVQAAVAASANVRAVPSNLQPPLGDATAEQSAMFGRACMRDFFSADQPECASGDTASRTTLALVGDSNAAMWTPAFEEVARERRWRLESLDKVGCPLFDLRLTTPHLRREYTECEQWRGRILSRLQAERPRLIALSISRTYRDQGFTAYDSAWIGGLTRLVQELRGTGAEVLVLGPIPDPQSKVPVCLSGHLDDATACGRSRSVAVDDVGIAAEATATRAAGGQYVDLTPLFCTTERCPVIVGDTLVYLDEVHLSYEYARQLAPVMGLLADRTLVHN
ncbi:acyltransferase, partial [Mycobacterium ahvazicum]